MCDEALDDYLAILKLVPDWFVKSKMIKKLCTTLQADNGLLFFDEDSGDVTFCCSEIGILSVNFNNINLDKNFAEDDPDTIFSIFSWGSWRFFYLIFSRFVILQII